MKTEINNETTILNKKIIEINKDNSKLNDGKIFSIEKSKSGRSCCKECRKKIPNNALRIVKSIPFKSKYTTHFFHVDCAFHTLKRARVKEEIVSDLRDIGGVDHLTQSEIKIIADTILKANSERTKCLHNFSTR